MEVPMQAPTKLTRNQESILQLVIKDTKEQQCAPTLARVCALDGRQVRQALVQLAHKGYLRQPYEGGPWVPVRSPEGRALTVVVMDGEVAAQRAFLDELTPERLERMSRPSKADVMSKMDEWIAQAERR
jgi:hypothetical protein